MNTKNKKNYGIVLIALEVSLLVILASFLFSSVFAGISEDNVTVVTQLTIENSYPEVLNVSMQNDASSLALTPANTTTVYCEALIVDYEGDSTIQIVNATLFDTGTSSIGGSDDNNNHYSNSSCDVQTDVTGNIWGVAENPYNALTNCTFEVEYYANPDTWDCVVTSTDDMVAAWTDTNSDSITISELLALGLPNTINYGSVNATYVSEENITNVTNYGNVQVNLSLNGYAETSGDGYAMNCSLGAVGYIDIMYEKYNLTASNPGALTLTEFENTHTNLTSTPVVREYNLNFRQDDVTNDAVDQTYWRMYVPLGVAGTCQGNIVFGAAQSPGI